MEIRLFFYRILSNQLLQNFSIMLKFNLPLKNTLSKPLELIQLRHWLDKQLTDRSKIRLSIRINNKPSNHTLYHTFIILFDTVDDLLDSSEKFFVKISIKKFITLDILSIRNHKLFLRHSFFKRIRSRSIFCSNLVPRGQCNIFARFTFNNMIFSVTFNGIALLHLTTIHLFLNHPPLVVKKLVSLLVLTNVLQKLKQSQLQNLLVSSADLHTLLFSYKLSVLTIIQSGRHILTQLRNRLELRY